MPKKKIIKGTKQALETLPTTSTTSAELASNKCDIPANTAPITKANQSVETDAKQPVVGHKNVVNNNTKFAQLLKSSAPAPTDYEASFRFIQNYIQKDIIETANKISTAPKNNQRKYKRKVNNIRSC